MSGLPFEIKFDDEEITESIEEYHLRETALPQIAIDEMLFRIKDYVIAGISDPVSNAYRQVLEEMTEDDFKGFVA
jgi:hypothetical protein